MKYLKQYSIFVNRLIIQFLAARFAQGFGFFYLVQQWPGSYCNTNRGCCYPTTGKPVKDFAASGFWPYNIDNTYPSNCDPSNHLDHRKISNLISKLQVSWPSLSCPSSNSSVFWSREWKIHGTCSELQQHAYFQTALNVKKKVNLLQILQSAGIKSDGKLYSYYSIRDGIGKALGGYTPGIVCVNDATGIRQLYQVYVCSDGDLTSSTAQAYHKANIVSPRSSSLPSSSS